MQGDSRRQYVKMDKKLLGKYDKNMRVNAASECQLDWHSPREVPFGVFGFAWFDEESSYRRLPKSVKGFVPEAVDHLANHTAGGQIRFQTNASTLSVRVRLTARADMPHMPATGQCGVDCYVSNEGTHYDFQYVNTTKYDPSQIEYECALYEDWSPNMRHVILNMPLYQGVKDISIGLSKGAIVKKTPDYVSDNKVIIYGTSITQGGCATRPGMMYSNILSRRIPLEFINLGFSGNGKGEPELAEVISQIDQPACLILDYEGNCVSTEKLKETLPEFIRIYRESHPLVPVVVASRIPYAREKLTPHLYQMRTERKDFQQRLVNTLRKQGDLNIYFFDGSKSLGTEDYFECTVDGSHPTDLGFIRMANALESTLKTLLL